MSSRVRKKYPKAFERAERKKMRRALVRSVCGAILSIVPILGLVLTLSGFWGLCVRITRRYRRKLATSLLIATLCLAVSVGVSVYEVYVYSRHPAIVSEAKDFIWLSMTGDAGAKAAGQTLVTSFAHPDSGETPSGSTAAPSFDFTDSELDDFSDYDWENEEIDWDLY